jgi:predicted membrane protein
MRRYFSFILIALICFLLNIFLLTNISDYSFFRGELIFVELMILFSIAVAIKLYYESRSSDILAIVFFIISVINSLVIFSRWKTTIPTTLLLINLFGLVYFVSSKRPRKKKAIMLKRKQAEIDKQIGPDTDDEPKVIVEKKRFVAGKTGKFYYEDDHPNVKRIKEKNKVYFSSKEEARKAGYKFKK